jgi:hypothetical protein
MVLNRQNSAMAQPMLKRASGEDSPQEQTIAQAKTAFPLRQAGGLNVRLAYPWNDPGTGRRLNEWADESLRVLRPSSNEQIYATFQTYEARSGAAAVYSVNFARLASLKDKYDPQNFFRRNSNVPPGRNAEAGSRV